jgi:hypothetical protein
MAMSRRQSVFAAGMVAVLLIQYCAVVTAAASGASVSAATARSADSKVGGWLPPIPTEPLPPPPPPPARRSPPPSPPHHHSAGPAEPSAD